MKKLILCLLLFVCTSCAHTTYVKGGLTTSETDAAACEQKAYDHGIERRRAARNYFDACMRAKGYSEQ